MAVKSITPDDIPTDIVTDGYPKLMISDSKDLIVLVTGERKMDETEMKATCGFFMSEENNVLLIGTVIVSREVRRPIGFHGNDWFAHKFTEYKKEVILKNC